MTPGAQANRHVLLEYWLAGKFGRIWLILHKNLQRTLGDLPGECALVARGQQLTAERLRRAQGFAARAWWRAGMIMILLIFPVIGIGALLRPGRFGTDIGAGLIFTLGCLAGISIAQMWLLSFRSGLTRKYLAQSGTGAADEPLPLGSGGLPTQWDFWVMLLVTVVVFGILLFAGTRTGHSG
jgi:hypothetical protein